MSDKNIYGLTEAYPEKVDYVVVQSQHDEQYLNLVGRYKDTLAHAMRWADDVPEDASGDPCHRYWESARWDVAAMIDRKLWAAREVTKAKKEAGLG